MALEEYKKKRNFSSTPEPAGDSDVVERRKQSRGELFFCVQKHLASHLHYDLRLEWNGVLLSWAVPKGPSIDPGDKRLAMHVEDHPIEYGTFEGVIPEGYGAGIVMLWDRGTWEPESEDVDAALKKGDLKFRLDGFKLKGSWVLVRTGGYGRSSSGRGSGDGRSWLLIKHRDDWAGPLDITTFAPLSVKTPDADLADILASGNPDIWRSHAPAKGGDTGAMFQRIIEQALEIKQSNTNTKAPKVAPASAAKAASARSRRSSQGDLAASEGGKAPKDEEAKEAKEPKGAKEKQGGSASAAPRRPAVKKAKAAKASRTSAKPPARRSTR